MITLEWSLSHRQQWLTVTSFSFPLQLIRAAVLAEAMSDIKLKCKLMGSYLQGGSNILLKGIGKVYGKHNELMLTHLLINFDADVVSSHKCLLFSFFFNIFVLYILDNARHAKHLAVSQWLCLYPAPLQPPLPLYSASPPCYCLSST